VYPIVVNNDISKESRTSVLVLKGLTLEEKIVRNPSMILSPILSINEKADKHIKNNTHKPIVLIFWIEGDVNPLI